MLDNYSWEINGNNHNDNKYFLHQDPRLEVRERAVGRPWVAQAGGAEGEPLEAAPGAKGGGGVATGEQEGKESFSNRVGNETVSSRKKGEAGRDRDCLDLARRSRKKILVWKRKKSIKSYNFFVKI